MSISFKDFLIEKRRFPEVNQKVDIIQYISSLKSGNGIYITFINEPKLGINPVNQYDTPTGIYSYPLVKFYDDVVKEKRIDSSIFKFQSNAKYICLFRINDKKRIIFSDEYTEEDFHEDFDLIDGYLYNNFSFPDYKQTIRDIKDHTNTQIKHITNLKSRIQHEIEIQRNKDNQNEELILKLYNSLFRLSALITKYKAKLQDLNSYDRSHNYDDYDEDSEPLHADDMDKILSDSYGFMKSFPRAEYFAALWSILFHVSKLIARTEKSLAVNVWNKLFYDVLNIGGMVDYGNGIIHGNEPTQAVFFSKDCLEPFFLGRNFTTREGKEVKGAILDNGSFDFDYNQPFGIDKQLVKLGVSINQFRADPVLLKKLIDNSFKLLEIEVDDIVNGEGSNDKKIERITKLKNDCNSIGWPNVMLFRSGFASVKKLTDKYGKEYFRNKTDVLFSNAINELKGIK